MKNIKSALGERETSPGGGGRFLFAILALGIGIACYWGGIYRAEYAAAHPTDTIAGDIWLAYFFGLFGAAWLAISIGQVMRLVWISGDESYDLRIWIHWTPAERGAYRLREKACESWPIQSWCVVSALTVVWQTVTMWRWISRNFTQIGLELVMFLIVAMALLLYLFRLMPAARSPDKIKLNNLESWVSRKRWKLTAEEIPWLSVCYALSVLVQLPLVPIAYSFFPAGMGGELFLLLMLPIGGVLLPLFCVAVLKRIYKRGCATLELNRINSAPLVFQGDIHFATPVADAGLQTSWSIQLLAFGHKKYRVLDNAIWIDQGSPLKMSADRARATFELKIDLPESVLYPNTVWIMRVVRSNDKVQLLEFRVPSDAILAEAYPADCLPESSATN